MCNDGQHFVPLSPYRHLCRETAVIINAARVTQPASGNFVDIAAQRRGFALITSRAAVLQGQQRTSDMSQHMTGVLLFNDRSGSISEKTLFLAFAACE